MPGTDLTARMFCFVRSKCQHPVRQMAAELGLHRSSLSRIELGRSYPSNQALARLEAFVERTSIFQCNCLPSLIQTMRNVERHQP